MLKIYVNEINKKTELDFELIQFNGGEPHIKFSQKSVERLSTYLKCIIVSNIQSFNDLGDLLVAINAIYNIDSSKLIDLKIPYFPGARQDRVSNKGEALTVKVYTEIINSLNSYVEICDPHSDVTPALLADCSLYPVENIIKEVIEDCMPDVIIIPDEGATKRTRKYLEAVNNIFNYSHVSKCGVNYSPELVQCLKIRDTKTGKLTGFEICKPALVKEKNCLVIDDICDAGGTFLGLADVLSAAGALKTSLYVTHGIFSKGYDALARCYSKIYTTDSFQSDYNPVGLRDRVKIFNLYGDN